jgi:hypothetical protein
MMDHGAQLQTEAPVGGQQGIPGDLRSHLAVPQDEVREDREDGFARGTLDTPDGEPTEADTGVMGVACEAATATTGRLVCQLKAKGEEKGEDAFEKRLAVAKELKVGGFVVKIDGDGAVFAGLASGIWHGSPSGQMVVTDDDPKWGYDGTIARGSRRVSELHH